MLLDDRFAPRAGPPFQAMTIEAQDAEIPATNSRVPSRGSTTRIRLFCKWENRRRVPRKANFTIPQQVLTKHGIDKAVGFRYGVMSYFAFGVDCARSKTTEHGPGRVQRSRDQLQDFRL